MKLNEIKKASAQYFDITKQKARDYKPGEHHWTGGKVVSVHTSEDDWKKALKKQHGPNLVFTAAALGTEAHAGGKKIGLLVKDGKSYVFESAVPRVSVKRLETSPRIDISSAVGSYAIVQGNKAERTNLNLDDAQEALKVYRQVSPHLQNLRIVFVTK